MATPHKLRILFVDDETYLQEIMRHELPSFGHEVTICPDGNSAMRTIQKATFDVAILDLRLPDMTGMDVLRWLKQVSPDTDAIMMTGHGTQDTVVEAMRLGAVDFLNKPCKMAEIEAILLRLLERRRMKNNNAALQTRVKAAEGPSMLIGQSPAMIPVQQLIATVAPTNSSVLILGETGTGKEMAARTLYQMSHRADGPFVPVNCGALAEHLVESELFGHRRGAFTGAERDHKGLFEVANGGTLFLDELGELNRNIQVKLLRFLESGEIRRVGDSEPIVVDVRVLCATNRDLWTMVSREEFREDLLYRLNTFEIRLPPLRERIADIPDLARHLLARTAKRPIEQVSRLLSPQALEVMCQYSWPGNVRELANAMEYAYIVSGGQPITDQHLPHTVRTGRQSMRPAQAAPMMSPPGYPQMGQSIPPNTMPYGIPPSHPQAHPQAMPYHPAQPGMGMPQAHPQAHPQSLPPMAPQGYLPPQSPVGAADPSMLAGGHSARTLRDIEMEHILRTLAKHGNNKQRTAEELGISVKTLYNKLTQYEEDRKAG
ncbi:sigma-54-dependent transcriptional regulator [Tuwongella immobilis]|uniref:Response regulatory domain-containing protein n=1 Tax=Tuwongella immobilis TaxID=692036 RepID=A0A6C2YR16_9BACT|nr:sigma-54 dependent transcriptional regulator [Tuwongella immobilis]VIP03322.1 acetoacetate metabolism regulatory protein : Sigma54 specific transcriptional regulator, Fis family OS=Isosphaera pallida (strain ATCC 43644 / DSM 9630 / IS1B) GN=Isop_1192 PE=4 SV=1: Response_reg: Sigma54_activat: HTH_8 [Tuwongella immobilis]VTS04015.1 acetoacetate metabolism regulatory protein : Sigma54 specific transcriptional regulator, Fis family OS=Isosphaera pallida (strain ATCC 43644 / DSM 9630 / IS1B) GN=Iso